MEKLDLKKVRKSLFTAPLNRFVTIDVPPVSYLMVDGHGDPNTVQAYRLAVESLYATAFTIKFSCKANGNDFVVMPLEGLWSAPDPESFSARRKDEWEWTMMIMVPDYVNDEAFLAARIKAREKLGALPESEARNPGGRPLPPGIARGQLRRRRTAAREVARGDHAFGRLRLRRSAS